MSSRQAVRVEVLDYLLGSLRNITDEPDVIAETDQISSVLCAENVFQEDLKVPVMLLERRFGHKGPSISGLFRQSRPAGQ